VQVLRTFVFSSTKSFELFDGITHLCFVYAVRQPFSGTGLNPFLATFVLWHCFDLLKIKREFNLNGS